MIKVGIGIITYNRRAEAMRTIEAVRDLTSTPHVLVVADDGSKDDTVSNVVGAGIRCVAGVNAGVAWNKNRALYYLRSVADCDVMILLEDDCFPTKPGWEIEWIDFTLKYGHINIASDGVKEHIVASVPGSENLYLAGVIAAQCASFSKAAIDAVGYMDTRFTGYGYEHVEHTKRFMKLGYGGIRDSQNGPELFYALDGALCCLQAPTVGTPETLEQNRSVYEPMLNDPVHRWPWRSRRQLATLHREMQSADARYRSHLFGRTV